MFFKNQSRSLTPEMRVSFFYFIQAMSVGVVNAFAGIWLNSIGITASQTGIIFAAPVALILIVGSYIGRLADRATDWRTVILGGAIISALLPVLLVAAQSFWSVLIVWTLAITSQMAILPVTDAAALRMSRRRGNDFGLYYAWKTVGYLLVVVLSGLLLSEYGVRAFLPLFIGFSILRGTAALGLPKFRVSITEIASQKTGQPSFNFQQAWFVLPLLAWSLVHCTHFLLSGFVGLFWYQQGLSEFSIGVLVGVSALSETLMFLGFKQFARRFSARLLIFVSCLVAVFRWTLLSLEPGFEVLVVAQILHAFTYALGFLACTNFIADWTDEEIAAEAQSFFVVLQSVIAICALTSFGWLSQMFGAQAFLGTAGLALLGSLLVLMSIVLSNSRD
ncbi:MFS transporter [Parasphingorhabdus sp.]|uniref:MFS transporter n=1 Tax=Parasphingorhabdus sp. TaxID=2709688 RepID=UPI00329A796D